MEIHGLVVSVNYADHLSRSLPLWQAGLSGLVVVTAPHDRDTIQLATSAGARCFVTDAFNRDGAAFNKGRAMQEARHLLRKSEVSNLKSEIGDPWHLFVDADVIPPANWLEIVNAAEPQPGWLCGARRIEEDGSPIPDGELAGYFQLFHAADKHAQQPLDIWWSHAGNYDSRFQQRWPGNRKGFIPGLTLTHLGERGANWCGRGNVAAMSALKAERERLGTYHHESITLAADQPSRSHGYTEPPLCSTT